MPPLRGTCSSSASLSSSAPRIVAHFDLDAFYVGCERELNPAALLGVPVAVCQYNPYGNLRETSSEEVDKRLIVRPGGKQHVDNNGDTNGSLIAVSYEARAASVKRSDRGREAVSKCPTLRIVQVPVRHGKADLSMYRDASYRVLNKLVQSIMESASSLTKAGASNIRVEKASIDEIYIDLTSATAEMTQRVIEEMRDQSSSSSAYWQEIMHTFGASHCTTIGGVEKGNANAMAANALSKDELRRGSHFQVLDSSSGRDMLDSGSRSWWHRSPRDMSDIDIALACGAALAAKARSDVANQFIAKAEDGAESRGKVFTLSAGISTNKTLSKLASGMKKPNRQTIINPDDDHALQTLFHPLPIGRIRGLGAKFGVEVSKKLGVSTVGDLAKLPLGDIQRHYPPSPDGGETAQFLFNISRGICTDEVDQRTLAKSIGCGKTFRNHLSLDPNNDRDIQKWAGELCEELTERLEVDRRENKRTPKIFGVSVSMSDKARSASKSTPAPRSYGKYVETATKLILQVVGSSSQLRIEGLTVWANNFVEVADESNNIMAAFAKSSGGGSSCGRGVKYSAASAKIACMQQQKKERKGLWPQSENNGNESNASNAEAEKAVEASGNSDVQLLDQVNDDIEPDVFSQLPPSIQAEIRMSREAAAAPKVGDVGRFDERKNGITCWLSNNGADRVKAGGASKALTAAAPSESFALLPNFNDVDQDTLAELPPDIREGVLRDIVAAAAAAESARRIPKRQQHQQQHKGNKRKRIDSFFASSDKK